MKYLESTAAKIELVMSAILLIIAIVIAYRMPELVETGSALIQKAEYTVIIDPGHGGNDPGKIGVNNAQEKDINLAIALKLRELFEDEDINVIMTREEDVGLYSESDSNKKSADMKARCEIINTAYEKDDSVITVSIHQNSYTSESIKGAQVFYYSESEKSRELAEIIQESLIKNLDNENTREAKANDNYYMLVNTDSPSVIVECGFLSNWEEAALLIDDDYQQQVAEAILEGVLTYFSTKKF